MLLEVCLQVGIWRVFPKERAFCEVPAVAHQENARPMAEALLGLCHPILVLSVVNMGQHGAIWNHLHILRDKPFSWQPPSTPSFPPRLGSPNSQITWLITDT